MSEGKNRPRSHNSRPVSRGSQHGSAEEVPGVLYNYWCSEGNDGVYVNFEQEISKCAPSRQTFEADLARLSSQHGIFQCPFIRSTLNEQGKTTVHIANTKIDIANWEIMLLASISSDASSFHFHNLDLTRTHILHLVACINKMEHVVELRLDYITLTEEDVDDCFAAVMALDVACVSLRGNGITDTFFKTTATSSLQVNTTMQVLNLSDNKLTDEGLRLLLESIRFSPNLKYVSVRNNLCNGSSVPTLLELLIASPMSPADAAVVKSLTSVVAAKNKKARDLAKKVHGKDKDSKAAASVVAVEDLIAPDSRVFKIGSETFVANRSFRELDLSWNPVVLDNIVAASEAVVTHPAFNASLGQFTTACTIKGLDSASATKLQDIGSTFGGSLIFRS
jgi:hypothetical protein